VKEGCSRGGEDHGKGRLSEGRHHGGRGGKGAYFFRRSTRVGAKSKPSRNPPLDLEKGSVETGGGGGESSFPASRRREIGLLREDLIFLLKKKETSKKRREKGRGLAQKGGVLRRNVGKVRRRSIIRWGGPISFHGGG